MRQSFLSFHQCRRLVFANLDKIPQLKAVCSQKRTTLERIPAFPYTSQAQAGTACRGSPEWLGWFSHRSVFAHASRLALSPLCGRACCRHRCDCSSDVCCIPSLSCPGKAVGQLDPTVGFVQSRKQLLKFNRS